MKEIKQNEELILDYIKNKIANNIQNYCQHHTATTLVDGYLDFEERQMPEIEKDVKEKLKKVAPLHYEFLRMSPIFTVMNNARNRVYGMRVFEGREIHPREIWGTIVCYNTFEKKGISAKFCKRVLNMYVDNEVLIKENAFGGQRFYFNVSDEKKLKATIKPLNVVLRWDGWRYSEEEHLKWVLDRWEKKTIQDIFEKEKDKIFKERDEKFYKKT